jgi:hypothetical protein
VTIRTHTHTHTHTHYQPMPHEMISWVCLCAFLDVLGRSRPYIEDPTLDQIEPDTLQRSEITASKCSASDCSPIVPIMLLDHRAYSHAPIASLYLAKYIISKSLTSTRGSFQELGSRYCFPIHSRLLATASTISAITADACLPALPWRNDILAVSLCNLSATACLKGIGLVIGP